MVLKSFTSQLALNVVDFVVRQSYVHDGTASDKLRRDCKKTECFKAGPLDLGFWSFLTFLHNGTEEVERHLL